MIAGKQSAFQTLTCTIWTVRLHVRPAFNFNLWFGRTERSANWYHLTVTPWDLPTASTTAARRLEVRVYAAIRRLHPTCLLLMLCFGNEMERRLIWVLWAGPSQ